MITHRKKPNIILISTDQQRWDHVGMAGVKGIETPNLDRLGKEGIHFNRAYCPSPICTPARVSLLTGQYPSSHGAYTIGVSCDPFPDRTLPNTLKGQGYRTALFGKSHFVRRADEEKHMSGQESVGPDFWKDWTGPYVGFDEVQASIGHTTNADPNQHYRLWLERKGLSQEDWKKWFPVTRGESFAPYSPGKWNIPSEYHDTEWVTECVENFIESQNPSREPWFCWASYQDPHEPYLCPEPWFSKVDMDAVSLFSEPSAEAFKDKPDVYEEILRVNPMKTKYNTDPYGVPCAYSQGFDKAEQRAALQATLGMVAFIDHGVGRILKKLENAGELDNTIIIFTSDHGEYHGHHGFWGKGIPAYEDAQRVPLLVRGPGVEAQGSIQTVVNILDLVNTLMLESDSELPQGVQGKDLRDIFRGDLPEESETIVECRANEMGIHQQTFITDRYKLVMYEQIEDGELYDLQEDPDQQKNLWSDSNFVDLKSALLVRWVRFIMKNGGHVHPRTSFA